MLRLRAMALAVRASCIPGSWILVMQFRWIRALVPGADPSCMDHVLSFSSLAPSGKSTGSRPSR